MKELELFPRDKVGAVSSRQNSAQEPRLWIEEVRLLREFAVGQESEIRRIVLRRGLNVVWAEAAPPVDIEKSQENSRAYGGHAAGKTSFCRIVRFLLGEPHFGSQFMRNRILNSFPDGWAVAKIWIDGKCWIVARSFYPGAHPWAIQSEDVEDIFDAGKNRVPYTEFVDALNASALSQLTVSSYGTTGKDIRFLHLLSWLARDQECRFSGLLEWRHPQSTHDTPDITAEEKRLMIRAVLGFTDKEEREIIEKRKRLEDRQAKLPNEIEYFRRVVRESFEGLANYLPVESLPKVEEPLFIDVVTRAVKQKEDAAVAPVQQISRELRIEDFQKDLEAKIARRGAAEQRQKEIQEEIEQVRTVLRESQSGKAEASTQAWLNTLPPDREHCRIPMVIARFRCPLQPLAEKPSAEERVTELSLNEKVQICEAKLTQLDTNFQQADRAAKQLLIEESQARTRYDQEVAKRDELLEKVRAIREANRVPRDLAMRASNAQTSIEAQQKEAEKLDVEIENSKKRQEELQKQRLQVLTQFAEYYRNAVQSVLGSDAEADCRFTREEIRLEISRNGELESGAIDTIKILAFDIAALRASIEGLGGHPRFLVHDSPREADMAAGLYHWIFRLAKSLEIPSTSESNSFQYILTTTEPPPNDVRKEPWLRLTLDASKEAERLFKKDL